MEPYFSQSHDAYAGGKHEDGYQDAGQSEGVVHHPMRHFEAPATQPVCCRIGVTCYVLLVLRSGEDVRNEGDEDGQRECGQDSTPDEAEVVFVFATHLRVNVVRVAYVGAEPIERPEPSRLRFRLVPCRGLACRLMLSYAFLCVHIIILSGCKDTTFNPKNKARNSKLFLFLTLKQLSAHA